MAAVVDVQRPCSVQISTQDIKRRGAPAPGREEAHVFKSTYSAFCVTSTRWKAGHKARK